MTGRAILDRRVVHMADVEDPRVPPTASAMARATGFRSVARRVPMLREGEPIGVDRRRARRSVGPFTDKQIELLKTFADQAVIAIENVRLFKELEARTGELTQSVEQLTALGEVSQAVSSTLDVETVLDTIVSRASQLAGARRLRDLRVRRGSRAVRAARHRTTTTADFVEALRAAPLRKGEGSSGAPPRSREPVQIPDITAAGRLPEQRRGTR